MTRRSAGPGAVRGTLRIAVLGAALLLAGCGFQPRGRLVAIDDPGRLFLDADRGLSIEEPLRAALRERAFTLASNRDVADIVLRVADERETQRIVSVRSTGRVSEYELAHVVSVTITRAADHEARAAVVPGAPVTDPEEAADAEPGTVPVAVSRRADQVQVTREYTYDESQVLGKENEARILRGEMSEELVRQIVLRTVASLARSADEAADAG